MSAKKHIRSSGERDWGTLALRMGHAIINAVLFLAVASVMLLVTITREVIKQNPNKLKY